MTDKIMSQQGRELYNQIFEHRHSLGNVLVCSDHFIVAFYKTNPGLEVPDSWYGRSVTVEENWGYAEPLAV